MKRISPQINRKCEDKIRRPSSQHVVEFHNNMRIPALEEHFANIDSQIHDPLEIRLYYIDLSR